MTFVLIILNQTIVHLFKQPKRYINVYDTYEIRREMGLAIFNAAVSKCFLTQRNSVEIVLNFYDDNLRMVQFCLGIKRKLRLVASCFFDLV